MVDNESISLRQRKKLDTRARILEASSSLFLRYGFAQPTIEDIAIAANVGKGTVYNYFPSKESMLVTFLLDLERRLQFTLSEYLTSDLPLVETLDRFAWAQIAFKEDYRPFVRVYFTQLSTNATFTSPWVQQTQLILDPPLARLFSHLQSRHLLRPDLDEATFITGFKLLQLSITQLWLMDSPPFEVTRLTLRSQVEIFARGIGAHS